MEIVTANDNVVEDWNPKKCACVAKPPRKHPVIIAGTERAGWVVVGNYQSDGPRENCALKHFADFDRASCGRSGCDNVVTCDLMLPVKKEGDEVLTHIVGKNLSNEGGCVNGLAYRV